MPSDSLEQIEIVRDDGEIIPTMLCEGCFDELEYAPVEPKREQAQ
jgi:hypothetical protein